MVIAKSRLKWNKDRKKKKNNFKPKMPLGKVFNTLGYYDHLKKPG